MHVLHRVRIIGARPGSAAPGFLVRVHDVNHGAVGAGDHQECSGNHYENSKGRRDRPLDRPLLLALAPVVVEPHAAHWLEAHERTQKGTDE